MAIFADALAASICSILTCIISTEGQICIDLADKHSQNSQFAQLPYRDVTSLGNDRNFTACLICILSYDR